MAAYSAVVSLEQLLNQLILNSDQSPTEELASLHGKISSLKSALETTFPAPTDKREEAKELAKEIREKIFYVQDTIESFILTQSHPSKSPANIQISALISSQKIIAAVNPIAEKARRLGDSVKEGRKDSQPVDELQNNKKASEQRGKSDKIVGQKEDKRRIEEKLKTEVKNREIIPILGMPGIGKTTLAKSIYDDATIQEHFTRRAWVTVSEDASVGDIYAKLLKSLDSRTQKAGDEKYQGTEDKLRKDLHQALYNNKYLVVIDDMWDTNTLKRVLTALPDNQNQSRVLLTTRESKVVESANKAFKLEMKPLGSKDSWTLLCNKTFGDDTTCVLELEELGRAIADNCKGLPLSLTVIGGFLSKNTGDASYWRSIKDDTYATRDSDPKKSLSGILSLCYDLLPCKLKGCFLYMGAFPEDSDIPVSKLIRLWIAEGFSTEPKSPSQLAEEVAEKFLLDLIDRNLVQIRTYRSNGDIKSCGMHDSLRYVAEKESKEDMFFQSQKKVSQKLEGNTNSLRRVSVHKNILMCLKEPYVSVLSITKARSLLCIGPPHPHPRPMPFLLTFDLLRVLDALTVFFIEFPTEILYLFHLRYLSFTYNWMLPKELSQLEKLQVLIVKREPNIVYVGTPFLPDEIWSMKELRHLLITETDFPGPTEQSPTSFVNLQTLLNVKADSCTEEALGRMPNLKRLGMWIEEPGEVGFHLNKLEKLEIFKFIVLNPVPGKKIQLKHELFFPETVRKLCLSGTGLPWEAMEAIAKLPNLQVLKLKELAFDGPDWPPSYIFKALKFMQIEYLNLKTWDAEVSQFPCLEKLIFRHCYKLQEIPLEIGGLPNLVLIELDDCSPSAVESANEIKEEQEEVYENVGLQVRTYSSWE